jgi:hypothetical protein
MAHHKRRRRRRAGIKGCCGMCMLRKTDGVRNHRTLTLPEVAIRYSEREQLEDLGVVMAWSTKTSLR